MISASCPIPALAEFIDEDVRVSLVASNVSADGNSRSYLEGILTAAQDGWLTILCEAGPTAIPMTAVRWVRRA